MKKFIISVIAFANILTASAITVSHDGKTVENGSTITFNSDAFKTEELVPGALYLIAAKEEFLVTGASNLSLTATSASQAITICELGENGNCYTFGGENGNYSISIPSFTNGVTVDLESFNTSTEIPKAINSTEITINSTDAPFKFTVVFDTETQSGISNVSVNSSNCYTVYNLNGVKVLDTKAKNDINKLPAGLYLVNGKKVLVK